MTWEAEILIDEVTDEFKKDVASIVKYPVHKTPDLLFFHGLYVSTGTNLNDAHFLGSEIISAYDTISLKALDIEHEEHAIVGHIYSATVTDRSGNVLDVDDLKKKTPTELNKLDIDVHIAGILYKSRFPELAKEVEEGRWKLSMETYFQDFDVKIGNVIMSRQEAEALGLATSSSLGKIASLIKDGVEIAKGNIVRVLKGLLFSGCGIVKNPAEPRAIIFEVANKNVDMTDIVVEFEKNEEEVSDNKTLSEDVLEKADLSTTEIRTQTSVGICVSFKKAVYSYDPPGPNDAILHENWCVLYEQGCTSASRGADHKDCLRNQIKEKTLACFKEKMNEESQRELLCGLLNVLKTKLN
jgi:hypothetical protein